LLETTVKICKPITKEDAIAVLKDLFEGHDPELGITWTTLEVALQEYHLDWKHLPEDRYGEVQGVFKVWRKGTPIAFQVGLFPKHILGNLPKALTLAKSLADQTPGTPILIGCEMRTSDDVDPWLSVTAKRMVCRWRKVRKHARRKTQSACPYPDHPDRSRRGCRPGLSRR
jgi:hypothetical protein